MQSYQSVIYLVRFDRLPYFNWNFIPETPWKRVTQPHRLLRLQKYMCAIDNSLSHFCFILSTFVQLVTHDNKDLAPFRLHCKVLISWSNFRISTQDVEATAEQTGLEVDLIEPAADIERGFLYCLIHRVLMYYFPWSIFEWISFMERGEISLYRSWILILLKYETTQVQYWLLVAVTACAWPR